MSQSTPEHKAHAPTTSAGADDTASPADATVPSDAPEQAEASLTPASDAKTKEDDKAKEIGGRDGLDPVRYGDWEKGGRCIDF